MNPKKILQIMHKYGKLSSCNAEKPNNADKLFVEELIQYIEVETGKQKTLL